MSVEFLLTAFIVVIAPGTGVVYTLTVGLGAGRAASLAAALGCTLGIVPHIAATVLGLAAVLHTSATAFQALKLAGVLYLAYLAWGMWREAGGAPVSASPLRQSPAVNHGRVALKGFLINILNPKLSIFFLAFLPQFIAPGTATPLADMLALSAVFMAMTWVVFSVYGLFAATFRHYVVDNHSVMSWIRRLFAGAFVALGVKLALADR